MVSPSRARVWFRLSAIVTVGTLLDSVSLAAAVAAWSKTTFGRISKATTVESASFSDGDQPGMFNTRSSLLRWAADNAVIRVRGAGTIICADGLRLSLIHI